jgi:hypothetical protein
MFGIETNFMKKTLFIFLTVAIYSCSSVPKIAEYKLENKKGKTFYPYYDDLRIKLTSDTGGIFINRTKSKDTITQKFVYHNQFTDNKKENIFRVIKNVDNNYENGVSLKQNDTLVFYKKGIYLRYKAPNTTQYLLYFKR